MSTEESPRAVVAALLANVGVALTKVLAFALTGAASMLAEAIHSFADCGNQGLLLLGRSRSRRAPTRLHPFGFGRERYIYAFLVSIVLFSVGGLFALYEAWHKLHDVRAGHSSDLLTSSWWWVPLVVLVVAIGLESLSLRTAVRASADSRGDVGWITFVRRATSPELPVVLLEDVAALVGLVFALAGVGLTLATRSAYWDVAGTAGIGLLLVVVAVVLGIEMKSLLVGEAAGVEDQAAIVAALAAVGGLRVVSLQTLLLGPSNLLVTCRGEVAATLSAGEVSALVADASDRIMAAVPAASDVFVETRVR
jgi:cation diffusion facilitator family transporter